MLKALLSRIAFSAGLAAPYRSLVNRRHGTTLRILSGHRVIDTAKLADDADRGDVARGCLTLATFAAALRHMAPRYALQPLDDCALRLGGAGLPLNSLALTFDDGYADLYHNVAPVLRALRLPATFFLTTGWIGRRPRMLTELQVRELAGDASLSISWGAHGVTHVPLTTLTPAAADDEIARSKEAVERMTGKPADLFAYPDGLWTPAIREAVRKRGFVAACATGRRINGREADLFALQRIPFEEEPLPRFAFRVAGRT